jgi:uncharacterized protein (TIGR03437 family)
VAVDRTCTRLARQPLSGTQYDSGVARLEDMRRAPVSGFAAYLIFYLSAQVLYFGKAGGYANLNQLNVLVPNEVAPRSDVPVRMNYIGRSSNRVTIGVE